VDASAGSLTSRAQRKPSQFIFVCGSVPFRCAGRTEILPDFNRRWVINDGINTLISAIMNVCGTKSKAKPREPQNSIEADRPNTRNMNSVNPAAPPAEQAEDGTTQV